MMTRYVDIVRVHDGETGAAGVPALCIEHDGSRSLGAGETRLTVEEYRAQEAEWRAAQEAWTASRPLPAPPEPVPQEVTNFQARAVLLATPSPTGIEGRTLFHDVNEAMVALGQFHPAFQAWEYANTITRNGATVEAMAAQFGLTSAQLDEMFRQAALVEA